MPNHDAFISYSRRDRSFATLLQKTLGGYRPPKDLNVPQHHLRIFRDEEDFTGTDYHQSLDKHLEESGKLIVLCSPHARYSPHPINYVDDEIRRFAKTKGAKNIIPILVSGIPNNEAKPGQEAEMAFPEALCEVMAMPLAAEYRNFDMRKDKINKGAFEGSWYKTLADLYGVSRSELEQREKKRQIRRRLFTAGLIVVIVGALGAAVIKAREATEQRQVAEEQLRVKESRRLAFAARDAVTDPQLSLLLGLEAVHQTYDKDGTATKEAQEALQWALQLLGGYNNFAREWDVTSGQTVLSPKGDTLAVVNDSAVTIFTIPSVDRMDRFQSKFHLSGHKRSILEATFSPDGRQLVTASEDRTARLWDVTTGKLLRTFSGHKGGVRSVAFSPDGRVLATASVDQTAKMWDMATGRPLLTLSAHASGVVSVRFSPDGHRLITAYDDMTAKTWDTDSGNPLLTIEGPRHTSHGDGMRLVAFSQNGKLIAIASGAVVTVWNSESGRKISLLSGQLDSISSVAFRPPDGAQLATASHDGTTRLWDIEAGQVVLDLFIGSGERISDVAFSKDGQYLATTGVQRLRQYPLNVKELLTVAQQFATRSMTIDECTRYSQKERCPPVH